MFINCKSSFEGRGKSGQWSTTYLLHPLDRQGVYERWLLQTLLDTKTVKNRLTKFSTFIAQLSHPSSVVIRVWQNDYLKYDITLILISQLCLGNKVTRAAFFLWQQCCHTDAFSNLNSFYLITDTIKRTAIGTKCQIFYLDIQMPQNNISSDLSCTL